MTVNKKFILSFVAPLMIFLSAIGLILRNNNKKIFYLPIGLMGVFIIAEIGINHTGSLDICKKFIDALFIPRMYN